MKNNQKWQSIKVTNALLPHKGSIKIGPFGSQLKKDFFVKDGFKVYGQENVFVNDFNLGTRYIDKNRFEHLKSCELKSGDIVITMMGTIGKVCIVPEGIKQGIMDSHLLRLQVDEKIFDKNFLIHILQDANGIQKQIKSKAVGGIMAGLSSKIVQSLTLIKPPLITQKKIASILSSLDTSIQKTNQIIQKTEQLKFGLMNELLNKGIGHRKFKKTKLGDTPEVWEIKSIEEFALLQRGFDLPIQNRTKGNYDLITSNGITDSHTKFKVKGPGVVTGRSGTLGKVFYVENDFWPLNTTLYVKDFHGNNEKFVYYKIQSLNISRFGTGTGVPTLNRNIVHKEPVGVPPYKEQIKIADILSKVDSKLSKEVKQKESLMMLKNGLMLDIINQKIEII